MPTNPNKQRQIRSLQEYEQLKRKNRRRLVGTSVMVVAAGLLLAKVLNQDTPDQTVEKVTIAGQTASDTEASKLAVSQPVTDEADLIEYASDLSPAAVLEPASEEEAPIGNKAVELSNPLQNEQAPVNEVSTSEDTNTSKNNRVLLPNPLTQPKPLESKTVPENTAPTSTQTKPAAKIQSKPKQVEVAPVPTVIVKNKVVASEQEKAREAELARQVELTRQTEQKRLAALKAQEQQQQQQQLKQQAITTERLQSQKATAQKAQQEAAQKKARAEAEAKKQAILKKQAELKKQQQAKTISAKEILQNKSAKATDSKTNPAAILEGKATPSANKALIQAGAFSNADQAKQMQQRLANVGVSTYVSETETSKGKVYRVRTGSYPSREAANKVLADIRKKGLDGMVVGQ